MSNLDLIGRRSYDVRQQLDEFKREFETWRNESNPNTALEKHHSQIRRITGWLEVFLAKLDASTGSTANSQMALTALLYAHRTWAFFRDKFALRSVRLFQDTLKCADEFAWECYRPAWEKAWAAGLVAVSDLKEPPLIFFSSSASPFIRRRDTPVDAEGVTADETERHAAELSFLPIPVISIPWPQANHLPSVVALAHEVGHAVERDFRLDRILDAALQNLPLEIEAQRRKAWSAWRSELFADTYGILCTGPAHLIALSGYLVGPHNEVTQETVNWNALGTYPTRSLRVEFNAEVLRQLGLSDEGVAAAWNQLYTHHTMPEYADFKRDIPAVVACFLHTPMPQLGGITIADIVQVKPEEWEIIKDKAKDLSVVSRKEPNLFRRTLAATTWAYYVDPAAYLADVKKLRLSFKLAQTIPSGTRGPEREDRQKAAALRAEQDVADAERAAALTASMLSEMDHG